MSHSIKHCYAPYTLLDADDARRDSSSLPPPARPSSCRQSAADLGHSGRRRSSLRPDHARLENSLNGARARPGLPFATFPLLSRRGADEAKKKRAASARPQPLDPPQPLAILAAQVQRPALESLAPTTPPLTALASVDTVHVDYLSRAHIAAFAISQPAPPLLQPWHAPADARS